ncbi:acetyl-lysine deacetylase [Halobacteriales archaeon QH_10_65_19]|nr:MAG: acetyl-lysine deacetylase [Halobacteriales archaeon QH_10_65_19]
MTGKGTQITGKPADEARQLLIDLVDIPSVTGNEGNCAVRLAAFFEDHGRDVRIDEAGNVRAPANDGVLLTSHIDTVPGEMLAAMAVAAVRTGASFLGVVGEEVDSRGSRHVVDTRESEPETVVNGEPSGWEGITLGYRGLLGGTYVATSESGHSSRPENNAIQDAMDWWNRVDAAFDRNEWEPVFERVTTKPVSFDGGISDDGLSVEATMDVQLRVPPEYTADQVREIADGCLENGTVTWYDRVEPTFQSPRTPVAAAFRAAIRKAGGQPRLLRKTGTSDMNIFAEHWNCPIVTYGPGDSGLDHTPNEHLPLPEYDRAIEVLETATERLL